MINSWLKLLKDKDNVMPVMPQSKEWLEKWIGSHSLFFKFKNIKKTGTFLKRHAYNNIFFKTGIGEYIPITQVIRSYETVHMIKNHSIRRRKIVKYYTEQNYKDIKEIEIRGSDPYLALPHVLAFWPDYDLLKDYYKGVSLEKIDQTLWAYQVYLTAINTPFFADFLDVMRRLCKVKRFNLFGFMGLIESGSVPLIYKDGVLLPFYYQMFDDLTVYDKPTTKDTLKAVVKKIADLDFQTRSNARHLSEETPYYWIKVLFPYIIHTMITDYGHVVNVFMFDSEQYRTRHLMSQKIYDSHQKMKEKLGYDFQVKVEKIATNEEDVKHFIKELKKGTIQLKLPFLYFGFDDEYAYLTVALTKDFRKISEFRMLKIPLSIIDSFEFPRWYSSSIIINGKSITFASLIPFIIGKLTPDEINPK